MAFVERVNDVNQTNRATIQADVFGDEIPETLLEPMVRLTRGGAWVMFHLTIRNRTGARGGSGHNFPPARRTFLLLRDLRFTGALLLWSNAGLIQKALKFGAGNSHFAKAGDDVQPTFDGRPVKRPIAKSR
jgi:hypothetical protein